MIGDFMDSELIFSGNVKNDDILVSFVIPTYKPNWMLDDVLNSIREQKNAKNISFEIIVGMNDPNGDVKQFVDNNKDLPIKFYKHKKNYGQVGNINRCIQLSSGKYISIIHDDDFLLDNYLDTMSDFILDTCSNYSCIVPSYYFLEKNYFFDIKHRLVSFVFCFRYLYRGRGKYIHKEDYIKSGRDVFNAPTCGTLFLKRAIKEFGYFRDMHGAAWDYYNYRLMCEIYDIFLVHKFTGVKRKFTGMSNLDKIQKEFKTDLEHMIIDNDENAFIQKNKKHLLNRRKTLSYYIYRIKTDFYYYCHNLDAEKNAPKYLYNLERSKQG